MYTKIPNKIALDRNRKNLQKMMGDEYAENINKTMVHIVHTCHSNEMEIEFYIEKYISNLHNNRIKKMLYLDAYLYLHPERVSD